MELGVGYNTPGIIKSPFWQMTDQWPDAFYACLNYGEAYAPKEIERKSLCIDGDFMTTLEALLESKSICLNSDIGKVLNNVLQ